MTRFGVPGQNIDSLSYADGRLATVPAIQAPRRPTTSDKKYPMWCEWRTNKDVTAPVTEGEFWKLVRFESNGDATWVRLSDASSHPIDSVDVDFNTAPGTDPTLPDVNGLISIFGNAVVNATNANSPVATHSRAANQFHVDVQLGTAVAPTPADPFDAGLLSMNNTHFTVDANGFTSLVGSIGFLWVEETGATRALLVNEGVVGNRGTAQTFTLPVTATFGEEIRIVNKGAGLITIAQNADQTIHFGSISSTTGAGGSVAATAIWDTLHLVCTTTDNDWTILNSIGVWNIT